MDTATPHLKPIIIFRHYLLQEAVPFEAAMMNRDTSIS